MEYETTSKLYGDPIFALVYMEKEREIFVDITSLSPDPREFMKPGIKYKALVIFEIQNDTYNYKEKYVLRKIRIENKTYLRIRL